MTVYKHSMSKRITVRVLPRSSKNEIVGEKEDGAIKIKTTAAPVDGAANEAVIKLLAEYYGVKKSAVMIVRGHTSKTKIVEIS